MSKVLGSSSVIIADAQAERVDFAVKNGFAHGGFVVPLKTGESLNGQLQTGIETAALAFDIKAANKKPLEEFDVVFECTGAEACTQAAIYVSISQSS